MSNAYMGQRQFSPSPMMGGYGGYGSPYGGMGGYGTQFGGYDMGGGYGGFGGYPQPSLMPAYQPTVNDLFSQYFSQQYYGGPAFNPFAATSMFGGGYGGGFGGGRGGGMGGRMRRRRQMFEDLFQPEQPPQASASSPLTTLPAPPTTLPAPLPQSAVQPITPEQPPQMAQGISGQPPSPVYGTTPPVAELAPEPVPYMPSVRDQYLPPPYMPTYYPEVPVSAFGYEPGRGRFREDFGPSMRY